MPSKPNASIVLPIAAAFPHHQQKRFMAYATYVAFAAYLDFARLLRPRLRAFGLFSLGFGRWAYLA